MASEIITGEDGVIMLKEVGGADIGEIPQLTNWTLSATVSISERATKVMLSNDDGGSTSGGGWVDNRVESKAWTVQATFFWQSDQAIPAAVELDPSNIGDSVDVELFPNNDTTGSRRYTGSAIIQNVNVTADVNGDITCTADLKGDGALSTSAEP